MSKGIIYCMTTIVPGLVKIGKTGKDNFEQRMYNLERNGYVNVAGLKRKFAIEVDDYDKKEVLIHELFSKSNVPNTELFAVDIELVVQLLSSFEGKQIYPKDISKERVFDIATDEIQKSKYAVPEGIYTISDRLKNKKDIKKAEMQVKNGKYIVLKGSYCLDIDLKKVDVNRIPEERRKAKIQNNVLMENVECNSPSTAGWIVLGYANNGWITWKTSEGKPIDIFRNNK